MPWILGNNVYNTGKEAFEAYCKTYKAFLLQDKHNKIVHKRSPSDAIKQYISMRVPNNIQTHVVVNFKAADMNKMAHSHQQIDQNDINRYYYYLNSGVTYSLTNNTYNKKENIFQFAAVPVLSDTDLLINFSLCDHIVSTNFIHNISYQRFYSWYLQQHTSTAAVYLRQTIEHIINATTLKQKIIEANGHPLTRALHKTMNIIFETIDSIRKEYLYNAYAFTSIKTHIDGIAGLLYEGLIKLFDVIPNDYKDRIFNDSDNNIEHQKFLLTTIYAPYFIFHGLECPNEYKDPAGWNRIKLAVNKLYELMKEQYQNKANKTFAPIVKGFVQSNACQLYFKSVAEIVDAVIEVILNQSKHYKEFQKHHSQQGSGSSVGGSHTEQEKRAEHCDIGEQQSPQTPQTNDIGEQQSPQTPQTAPSDQMDKKTAYECARELSTLFKFNLINHENETVPSVNSVQSLYYSAYLSLKMKDFLNKSAKNNDGQAHSVELAKHKIMSDTVKISLLCSTNYQKEEDRKTPPFNQIMRTELHAVIQGIKTYDINDLNNNNYIREIARHKHHSTADYINKFAVKDIISLVTRASGAMQLSWGRRNAYTCANNGRVDMRRLAKFCYDIEQYPFKQMQQHYYPKTRVIIVLDNSASMQTSIAENYAVALAWARELRRLPEVTTGICTFKHWALHTDEPFNAWRTVLADGNTPLDSTLHCLAKYIMKHNTSEKNLFIIVTDGAPDSELFCRNAAMQLQKLGNVFGIYYNSHADTEYTVSCGKQISRVLGDAMVITASSPDELRKAILEIVRQTILIIDS